MAVEAVQEHGKSKAVAVSDSQSSANGNGTESVSRRKTEAPKKKISITERSGLQFSVPRVLKNLKGNNPNTGAKKIKPTAAIYMAAILEYLSAEILELAGNASRELRKKTVQPRHLLLAIKGDAELDTLIKATIPGGGVIPHIHKFLFPKVLTDILPVAFTPSLTHGSMEIENVSINSAEHPAKQLSIPTSNFLNEVSVANVPSSKESSTVVKDHEVVNQKTSPESIGSDIDPEAVTDSASANLQHISAHLPQKTDLIQHLNEAILKRQEDLKDYLVIGNIPTPILHYRVDDKGQSLTAKLLSTEGHVVNEFSQHGSYQEQEVRTKRRRKNKPSLAGSEISPFLDDRKFNSCKLLSSLRYLSAFMTSRTLIKPEILNIIWKSFFLDSNEVLLHLKAENVLKEYFMFFPWSKDSNRIALMDSVLSSLRDVSDQSMFSKFDRENSRDSFDVYDFFEKIIEKCSTENENQGAISLLNILVFVFKIDFTQWWKEEEWKGKFPMIYYVLGVSSFKRNMLKIVATLFKNKGEIKKLAREFLSLTAMLSAFLDHSVEKEDYIHQGYKSELAEVIANVLGEEKDPAIIFVELSLLQPSWLSLLVSKCFFNVHQSSKKTPSLCEMSSMMKKLSLGDDMRSSYLFENLQYRLVCMSQSHILFRANWFFTSNKEEMIKFEVFSKMKELPVNSRNKKRDVLFKCLVKVSLDRQTEDLNTISDIARGVRKVVGEPGGAERALLFVMTGEQDLGWHPAIP